MSAMHHAAFIIAAYAVALVLLAAEVGLLIRRSRSQPPLPEPEQDDEA